MQRWLLSKTPLDPPIIDALWIKVEALCKNLARYRPAGLEKLFILPCSSLELLNRELLKIFIEDASIYLLDCTFPFSGGGFN